MGSARRPARGDSGPMSEKLVFFLKRLVRKTWLRCALFALLACAAVMLATWAGPHIPDGTAIDLGSDALDSLLNILASSMLTVSIFSASTMVSAFSAVAKSATPRASQLLIEDSTVQNTLAVFIGAFIYGVIALVGLHAHVYGDGGRLVLFGFTLLILLGVVVVLLRWIDYLSVLGRLGETIRRLEEATRKAIDQRIDKPYLGGRRQQSGERGSHEVRSSATGFVQHVAMDQLQARAEALDGEIHLHVLPGAFVAPGAVLASSDRPLDGAARDAIRQAVLIGNGRTFDHDPRYGFVVMGEIAARAMSASINDPGTALEVIGAGVRTLAHWAARQQEAASPSASTSGSAASAPSSPPPCDRVTAPALREAGMVEDVFEPLARYAAGAVEVGIALQRALRSVGMLHPALRGPSERLSAYALERAEKADLCGTDVEALRGAAREATGGTRFSAIPGMSDTSAL